MTTSAVVLPRRLFDHRVEAGFRRTRPEDGHALVGSIGGELVRACGEIPRPSAGSAAIDGAGNDMTIGPEDVRTGHRDLEGNFLSCRNWFGGDRLARHPRAADSEIVFSHELRAV